MDMKKIQELPTPEDLKKEFPLPYKVCFKTMQKG